MTKKRKAPAHANAHAEAVGLPEGWAWAPLDEIGDWHGGGTPTTTNTAYWEAGSIMWVSPKDMKSDVVRTTEDHITPAAIANSTAKLVPQNSVLIVTRSGILKHSLPIATIETPVALNQDLKALAPRGGISAQYIAMSLRRLEKQILRECTKDGTTVQSVETSRLKCIRIALAPLREQARIVAKLDELFSDIEAGEKALERAALLVKRYRQSVLKAAVTGELTKDWRAKNLARVKNEKKTGTDLLAKILLKRRAAWEANELAKMIAKGKPPKDDKWKKKYFEPAAPKIDDLPDLPEGWVWSSLGQLFQVAVGTTPSRSNLTYWGGSVPWVSSGEVAFSRIRETRETITEAGLGNPITRLHPPGTVMLAMIGEGKTRGQAAILDVACAHNQNAASIRVSETDVPPEYVFEFLRERYEQTRRGGQGGNQPALNKGIVESIPIPLPPLGEITAIVSELSLMASVVDEALDTIETQQRRSERLRQSVLRAAFSGQLVRQEPHDEPASALLERIRAERKAPKSQPPKAQTKTKSPGTRRGRRKKVPESVNAQGKLL